MEIAVILIFRWGVPLVFREKMFLTILTKRSATIPLFQLLIIVMDRAIIPMTLYPFPQPSKCPLSIHYSAIEAQSAIVTDNHDPKGLGRIRVKFHWMTDGEKSPWLRVTSLYGGDGKGMFFIPEIGEEVMVGFEGNSPTKPYIIGTVYNGKAKTNFSNQDNDVKVLQTKRQPDHYE